ncbi:hypothetical protein B0H19DRAFT_129601 [Mycena capillaripes]|nr:hypothetical protein B0H19DRAFT_129601 [Mycena capillaripes]
MLLWVITPQNLIFLGLHVLIAKLYANSLLVTLNTWKNIQLSHSTCACGEQRSPVLYLETRPQKVPGEYLASLFSPIWELYIDHRNRLARQRNALRCKSMWRLRRMFSMMERRLPARNKKQLLCTFYVCCNMFKMHVGLLNILCKYSDQTGKFSTTCSYPGHRTRATSLQRVL